MDVVRCDRCGEIHSKMGNATVEFLYKGSQTLDLCKGCAEKLAKFLKSKDNN